MEKTSLVGDYVVLEPLVREHTSRLEKHFSQDLFKYYVRSYRTAYDFVEENLENERLGLIIPFAIINRRTQEAIGCTKYAYYSPEHRKVEIGGSWVSKSLQGLVYNTEAKLLLLTHAFEKLGCLRVELKTDSLNEVSHAAILKIGAKKEGVLRNHMVREDGRRRHTIYFSIIEEEWLQTKLILQARLRKKANS